MRSTTIVLTVALLGAGFVAAVALHRDNTTRRVQLLELRGRNPTLVPRSAQTQASATAAPRRSSAEQNELSRLRAEISALEQRAAEQHTRNSDGTDAPAQNRDPEQGMTRLENLANVGQMTPAKAFQTLAWAALTGDEQSLLQSIAMDDAAREKVNAFIARLPEEGRGGYSSPEKVMALFLSKALVNVSAIQITETNFQDPQNATITVRGLVGNEQRLPMRQGPTGWQLYEGEKQVDWMLDQLAKAKPN